MLMVLWVAHTCRLHAGGRRGPESLVIKSWCGVARAALLACCAAVAIPWAACRLAHVAARHAPSAPPACERGTSRVPPAGPDVSSRYPRSSHRRHLPRGNHQSMRALPLRQQPPCCRDAERQTLAPHVTCRGVPRRRRGWLWVRMHGDSAPEMLAGFKPHQRCGFPSAQRSPVSR